MDTVPSLRRVFLHEHSWKFKQTNQGPNIHTQLLKYNVFACLAHHYIVDETAGDGAKDVPRGTRREVAADGPWDVDSI